MSRIANNPIKISKEVNALSKMEFFQLKENLDRCKLINSNYNININDNEIKVVPNMDNN